MDAAPPLVAADGGGERDASAEPDGAMPPPCSIALGPKLIAHACQHVEIGPLIEVAAAADAQALPSAVSASHTAYAVSIAGGEGSLSYRPSRPGTHLIMTHPAVPVTVLDAHTRRALAARHEQAIEACPDGLSSAYGVQLEASRDYRIVLGAAPSLRLFVEHAETYGRDAWTESECK